MNFGKASQHLGNAKNWPKYEQLKAHVLDIDWNSIGGELHTPHQQLFQGTKIAIPSIGFFNPAGENARYVWKGQNTSLIQEFCDWLISQFYPQHRVWILQMTNLPPNGKIDYHVDGKRFHHMTHRLHVPFKTNSNVKMFSTQGVTHYNEGEVWEINNCVPHWVEASNNTENRVHMLVDLIGEFVFADFPGGEQACAAWLQKRVVFNDLSLWEQAAWPK